MSYSIKIYKHSNFRGRSAELHEGEYATVPSYVGNDQISSIKVLPGFYAQIYEHSGFRGRFVTLFQGNYTNIPHWNDRISSIKVFKYNHTMFPLVEFFQDSNFRGFRLALAGTGQDTGYNMPFVKNDSISSMKVPEGTRVILFEHSRFRGKSKEFSPGEYKSLSTFGWNDKVSSVKIITSDLKLINIEYLDEVELPNGSPIAISSSTRNETDILQEASVVLSRELTRSSTRSWSNATMVGISVSVSSKVGVSKGPLSAEVSTTLTTTLENTFTIGEEESKSDTLLFQKTVDFDVPPKSVGKVSIMLTPKKYKVTARYTFQLEGTDKIDTQEAEIFIETYQKGEAIIQSEPIPGDVLEASVS
ncbi:MAG: beta/gamma crystallin-related protein [Bacteroidota bacterium]